MIIKQQQQGFVEENMSNNLTCPPCGEPSVSSTSLISYHQEQYVPQQIISQDQDQDPQPPNKKKRSLPGNPDPEAQVIALSPKSLLATNRFVCEICNKGFQRDQNLQLHRRGHNLPWKLKQRNNKEILRKKVYVCPEPSCVHHDPSRALGDLTGIKKHFCRKHGEKKWKCEKCSKRYAVQSDWKAHSKVCGTREYRCDCGTLFSRRDSFITHRACCDALAEETARSITTNSFLPNPITIAGSSTTSHLLINLQQQQQQTLLYNNTQQQQDNNIPLHSFPSIKREQQQPNLMINTLPPWLDHHLSSPSSSSSSIFHHQQDNVGNPSNINSNNTQGGPTSGYNGTIYNTQPLPSPLMSATALLQKAAQMGATMSQHHQHPQCHVTDTITNNSTTSGTATGLFGLDLSSHEAHTATHANGSTLLVDPGQGPGPSSGLGLRPGPGPGPRPTTFLHDMMMNTLPSSSSYDHNDDGKGFARGKNGNEGMTRDFLGLRPLSQSEILSIAGLENCLSNHNVDNSYDHHQHDITHKQQPWQGIIVPGMTTLARVNEQS